MKTFIKSGIAAGLFILGSQLTSQAQGTPTIGTSVINGNQTSTPLTIYSNASSNPGSFLQLNPINGGGGIIYSSGYNWTGDYNAHNFRTEAWQPATSSWLTTSRMVINNYGNVGIGTITPWAGLHVANATTWGVSLWLDARAISNGGGKVWALQSGTSTHSSGAGGFSIRNETDGKDAVVIKGTTGDIGINTASPSGAFEIAHNNASSLILNRLNGNTSSSEIKFKQNGVGKWNMGISNPGNEGDFFLWTEAGQNLPFAITSAGLVKMSQKVLIGGLLSPKAPHTDYKLGVQGKLVAQSIYVTNVSEWADYVFADNYKLTPLSEVEAYVKENKHLPEIPSEAEVMEQGIDVAKMDALLLKKIEELTLHMIEIQKQNEQLKARVQTLEGK